MEKAIRTTLSGASGSHIGTKRLPFPAKHEGLLSEKKHMRFFNSKPSASFQGNGRRDCFGPASVSPIWADARFSV